VFVKLKDLKIQLMIPSKHYRRSRCQRLFFFNLHLTWSLFIKRSITLQSVKKSFH